MNLNKTVVGMALLLTMFAANKATAQAVKGNVKMPFNKEFSDKLDEKFKFVSVEKIAKNAPEMRSKGMEVDVVIMDNMVIVDDEHHVQYIKNNPEYIRQINQAAAFSQNLPKGSVVNIGVGPFVQQFNAGIYTPQKTKMSADFNGTPAENLKAVDYKLEDFKNQIRTNSFYGTEAKKYSKEELADMNEKVYLGEAVFDPATLKVKTSDNKPG